MWVIGSSTDRRQFGAKSAEHLLVVQLGTLFLVYLYPLRARLPPRTVPLADPA